MFMFVARCERYIVTKPLFQNIFTQKHAAEYLVCIIFYYNDNIIIDIPNGQRTIVSMPVFLFSGLILSILIPRLGFHVFHEY